MDTTQLATAYPKKYSAEQNALFSYTGEFSADQISAAHSETSTSSNLKRFFRIRLSYWNVGIFGTFGRFLYRGR
jgi:hypothetical protein